jgi:ketosteroid isomerase-like protein
VSEQNIEIARRLYEAWARGETPGPPALLHPEIEYVNPPGAIEPGTRRGLEAFTAAIEKTLEGWSSWEMEPESFTVLDDERVAVAVRYRASGRTSGIEVEGRESALVTVREGLIVRYAWFHGPDDALRAGSSS